MHINCFLQVLNNKWPILHILRTMPSNIWAELQQRVGKNGVLHGKFLFATLQMCGAAQFCNCGQPSGTEQTIVLQRLRDGRD